MTVVLCKVHIRFGENEIELEGDREFVQETFRDFKDGWFTGQALDQLQTNGNNRSLLEAEARPVITVATEMVPPTLISFLREKVIKGFADTALAIAVYLYKYQGKLTFTKDDIETSARKALLSKSKNISRDINQSRRKGFIEITDDKQDGLTIYRVSQDGIDYVNSLKGAQ